MNICSKITLEAELYLSKVSESAKFNQQIILVAFAKIWSILHDKAILLSFGIFDRRNEIWRCRWCRGFLFLLDSACCKDNLIINCNIFIFHQTLFFVKWCSNCKLCIYYVTGAQLWIHWLKYSILFQTIQLFILCLFSVIMKSSSLLKTVYLNEFVWFFWYVNVHFFGQILFMWYWIDSFVIVYNFWFYFVFNG
jgi:hypothetical protein